MISRPGSPARARASLPHALSIGAACVFALLAATAASAQAAKPGAVTEPSVPEELVVGYEAGASASERASVRAAEGARLKRKLALPDTELVRVRKGDSVKAAAARLERRPKVSYAEPNFVYQAALTPTDASFGQLWGLHNTGQLVNGVAGTADADIDAPEAWNTSTGSASTTVAVVDTGIAFDHPDLAANIWSNAGETGVDEDGADKRWNGADDDFNGKTDDWRGWDFVGAAAGTAGDADNNPRDLHKHGTHVAGTIGAKASTAVPWGTPNVAGVNWNVKLMPVRVLDHTGSGTNADVADGFAYAGQMRAQVVNASLSGPGKSATMDRAIRAYPKTLYVVAASNEGTDNNIVHKYPCDYSAANLVCVAATTQSDALASFSNFSDVSVDLGAPGTSVLSTVLGDMTAFTTLVSETFETDIAGRWSTGGTSNSWARTTSVKNGGAFSLTDSPAGSYLDNTNSWAQKTAAVDLSGRNDCEVRYWANTALEYGYDFLHVEASSTPTDPASWDTLASNTGTATGFATASLAAFDGKSPVYVRFRLATDSSVVADGVYIDDVSVRCLAPTYSASSYEYLNGTSMATPHVAGVAGLLFAWSPTSTVASIRSVLLRSGDAKAALTGKTVTGRRLNAFNAVNEGVASVTGSTLNYKAPPGRNDNLTLTHATSGTGFVEYTVTNSASNLIPGAGCTIVTGTQVSCRVPTTLPPQLNVTTSDGNDVVTVSGAHAATIDGGSGNDTLRGGTGQDTLNGNVGTDTISYSTRTTATVVNLDGLRNDGVDPNGNRISSGTEESDLDLSIENATTGSGADWLSAIAANTVVNVLDGGAGDDKLKSRDGTVAVDQLLCGLDTDQYDRDASDTISACETPATF